MYETPEIKVQLISEETLSIDFNGMCEFKNLAAVVVAESIVKSLLLNRKYSHVTPCMTVEFLNIFNPVVEILYK